MSEIFNFQPMQIICGGISRTTTMQKTIVYLVIHPQEKRFCVLRTTKGLYNKLVPSLWYSNSFFCLLSPHFVRLPVASHLDIINI